MCRGVFVADINGSYVPEVRSNNGEKDQDKITIKSTQAEEFVPICGNKSSISPVSISASNGDLSYLKTRRVLREGRLQPKLIVHSSMICKSGSKTTVPVQMYFQYYYVNICL